MKKHTIRFSQINRQLYDCIVNGTKTIETRAASIKYQNIQPGDKLVIVCLPDRIEKNVSKVYNFSSIEELFKAVDLKKVIPFATSLNDAKSMYYGFPGYKQKIEQYGLIAFELT